MNPSQFHIAYDLKEDGKRFLELALVANFYWSTADAGPMGGCEPLLNRFWPLIADQARVYQTTWMKRPKKIDSRARELIADILAGQLEDGFSALIVDDRASKDESAVNGLALSVAEYRGVGSLTLKLAPDFDSEAFSGVLLEATNTMPYLHGSAGFGLVYEALGDLASTSKSRLFALGMRHPGLDLQSANITSLCAANGIKSVNWLTFVGDALLARAGVSLTPGPHGALLVHRQQHGWVVQAGDAPCIGDVNRRATCPAYHEAGRLLAPVRARPHPAFILDEQVPMGSPERTEAWTSRFDT